MTPSLEAVLFSSPTVNLNINQLSQGLEGKDLLFRNRQLNGCILFKFPNFDTTDDHTGGIPGLDVYSNKSGSAPVRTGIYVPKDPSDLPLGGYGIYVDDRKTEELMVRHLGMSTKDEQYADDFKLLKLIELMPSLDPFILELSLRQNNVTVHPRYVMIQEEQVRQVRAIIAEKVKPIIAKAMGISDMGSLEHKAKRFVDAIWDPSLGEANIFITAFGINQSDAPRTFSAWKGVTFFQFEFNRAQGDLARMMAWLGTSDSLPSDFRQLKDGEKQQITMFRDSIRTKLQKVLKNVNGIFNSYESSYQQFIREANPKPFREFLFKAESFYWTLGACNGVLAQVTSTWRRYCFAGGGAKRQLNFDMMERFYKVCDSILKSRAGERDAIA